MIKDYMNHGSAGSKKVLMIVAPTNFRDEEFFDPKKILEENGYTIVIASKGMNSVISSFGKSISMDIDISMKPVIVDDYAAVIFVGGTGSSVYFEYDRALKIAQEAFVSNNVKVLAAICIAPTILGNAGVLKGKRVTSWPSEQVDLERSGATYTGEHVTIDGKIVTANGPRVAEEFGKAILSLLSKN
ncbi:MAG: DJ-1/PfpI family protein [Candidatus Aenigmatarchaeota archaeon]